jgi:hypothetical protein
MTYFNTVIGNSISATKNKKKWYEVADEIAARLILLNSICSTFSNYVVYNISLFLSFLYRCRIFSRTKRPLVVRRVSIHESGSARITSTHHGFSHILPPANCPGAPRR